MEYPSTSATRHTLDNGFTLILDPSASTPLVSAQLWVETGSIHEGPLLGSGVSHFLEHMVFKGAGQYDSVQLAEAVQAVGGAWNAYTTFDHTCYYIDGPSTGLTVFLDVLSAMVFHPHLPLEEFEKEKEVIRREIDMGLDDPDDQAQRLLFETAFMRDPRRQPVIGHRELFDQITHANLVDYHAKRYTPNRAFLSISGDFEIDTVLKFAESSLSPLPRSMADEPEISPEPPQFSSRIARRNFDVPHTQLAIAWHTPQAGHRIQPALDLAATMLSSGRSSRLYREIRENQGLALEIGAWNYSNHSLPGLFTINAHCLPENRSELTREIHKILSEFIDNPSQKEFDKAQRQLALSQFNILTSISGRATDLGSNWFSGRDLDLTRNYLKRLQKLNLEDISAALKRITSAPETTIFIDPIDTPPAAIIAPDKPIIGKVSKDISHVKNGVKLAIIRDTRVPLFSLTASLSAGALSETEDTAGINSLLARCLPKATANHNAVELSELLESLGAQITAGVDSNTFHLRLRGLASDLPTLIPLFGEILSSPAIAPDSLEREKSAQLASLKLNLIDPLSLAFLKSHEQTFGKSGYGLPALGTIESLPNLNRDQLLAHHEKYFCGSNLKLSLVGDVDPEQAQQLLSTALSELPVGKIELATSAPQNEADTTTLFLNKKQAALILSFPGIAVADPRRHAIAAFLSWCNDMSGPLFVKIREEHGLAYQVGAFSLRGYDAGRLFFYLVTAPEQLEMAQETLLSTLSDLAANTISNELLDSIRATILTSILRQYESPKRLSALVANSLALGLPLLSSQELIAVYNALTPESLQTSIQELLSQAPTITRVIGKAE